MMALDQRLFVVCLDEAIRGRVKKFVLDTHRVKWSKNVTKQIRLSHSERKLTQVRSFKKAAKLASLIQSNIIGDEMHNKIVNLSKESAENYLIAEDFYQDFCSMNFSHEFWPWVRADIVGALTEVLLGIEGEYLFKWKVYKKGHYICGYTKEGGMYVF